MNFRGRARSRPARGKCPKALRKRRPIAAYKQFPERKRRNARARKRRRETEQTKVGGDRTHSADRTTKRHTGNGADLPHRSASKACSSSIRDRWLGPCCSVRAAAQRLRSFLGRRRRRRCRRCSADPSHGTAAYPPCSHGHEGRPTIFTGFRYNSLRLIVSRKIQKTSLNGYPHWISRIWSPQPKWMTVCLSWAF